jgi:hypothetical protein
MPPETPVKSPAYSEPKEEAKHPGAVLGLIMGVYPAIFIVGLLLAIGFLSLRSMAPSNPPVSKPTETDPTQQTTTSSRNNE